MLRNNSLHLSCEYNYLCNSLAKKSLAIKESKSRVWVRTHESIVNTTQNAVAKYKEFAFWQNTHAEYVYDLTYVKVEFLLRNTWL